jgi:hypothetical protein
MSGLAGANDKERLDNLITKTHKEQAVWFLNAFWEVRGFISPPPPKPINSGFLPSVRAFQLHTQMPSV